jgi:hypothetical protein
MLVLLPSSVSEATKCFFLSSADDENQAKLMFWVSKLLRQAMRAFLDKMPGTSTLLYALGKLESLPLFQIFWYVSNARMDIIVKKRFSSRKSTERALEITQGHGVGY